MVFLNRGSYLLSRLANYYPTLFTKLVFIDIGYATPGRGLSTQTVQFVNQMVKSKAGYEVFGYFLFFDEEGAGALMDENVSISQYFSTSRAQRFILAREANGK